MRQEKRRDGTGWSKTHGGMVNGEGLVEGEVRHTVRWATSVLDCCAGEGHDTQNRKTSDAHVY